MLEPNTGPLLAVSELRKEFRTSGWRGEGGRLIAVDDVSFEVRAGTTFGLVGESGSGKSTVGRLVTKLTHPTAGSIKFAGYEIGNVKGRHLRRLRGEFHMVFQDPTSSLDPTWSVRRTIEEPLLRRGPKPRPTSAERKARVRELLDLVHLPQSIAEKKPERLSGGQAQRVAIARSLASSPRLVVLDEPTSALDVSIQAQILHLLKELQRELELSYIFISHDLEVVRLIADTIAVMRFGRIIEQGAAKTIISDPDHDYIRLLVDSARDPNVQSRDRSNSDAS